MSKISGIVIIGWNCPELFQHTLIVQIAMELSQKAEIVLKPLELSQDAGTVPKGWICPKIIEIVQKTLEWSQDAGIVQKLLKLSQNGQFRLLNKPSSGRNEKIRPLFII